MKHRVLVVEDEPDLRDVLCEILAFEGILTVQARHGLQAIQILQEDSAFDLIILDWNMPHMNGGEFIRKLNEMNFVLERKKIPLIVVSANRPPDLSREYPFFEKPFSVFDILKAVTSLFNIK